MAARAISTVYGACLSSVNEGGGGAGGPSGQGSMVSMKYLGRLYRIIDISRDTLIVLLLGFIIVAGAINILLRYGTDLGSFTWSDEILRYLNIWIVFLGASVGVKRSAHMKVGYFLNRFLSEKKVRAVNNAVHILVICTLMVLVMGGIQKVIKFLDVEIQSLAVSIAWFYLAIPVGCLLMMLDYLLILIYGEHPFDRHHLGNQGDSCST